MKIYDVSDCEVKIVRPGTNLTTYIQNHTPFAACNGSLYNLSTREPCGTIIENGSCVHGEGEKFGFGVRPNGEWGFDLPWPYGKIPWHEFISGYSSPVQNGIYKTPGWRDNYVFNSKTARIGIGEKNDKLYIVTDDNVTMKQFGDNAIALGFKNLAALDGGTSRHLYYDKKIIYASSRVPYNALIFYKKKPVIIPQLEPKPVVNSIKVGSTVKIKQGAKTYTGGKLASFVYGRTYKVKQINNDRVVVTFCGIIVAAVKMSDLTLIS